MNGPELRNFRVTLHRRRFFVGMLPQSTTSQDLENYFKAYGPIESAYVIDSPKNAQTHKFGYVIFSSEDVLESNILKTNHRIKGQKVIVDIFKGKNSAENGQKQEGESFFPTSKLELQEFYNSKKIGMFSQTKIQDQMFSHLLTNYMQNLGSPTHMTTQIPQIPRIPDLVSFSELSMGQISPSHMKHSLFSKQGSSDVFMGISPDISPTNLNSSQINSPF
jgi:RNA recognition motif-containing protein